MVRRHLAQEYGIEGPRHDPYSYAEHKMYVDDKVFTLHYGLDVWASATESGMLIYRMGFSNHPMEARGPRNTEQDIIAQWEQDVGLTLNQFIKAYDRVHGPPQTDKCPDCGDRLASGSGYVGEMMIYCTNKDCHYAWCEPVTLAMIE